jgi:hypothetical protein
MISLYFGNMRTVSEMTDERVGDLPAVHGQPSAFQSFELSEGGVMPSRFIL